MSQNMKTEKTDFKCDNFDYTIWRREYFDQMDLEQVSAEAAAYARNHLHNGEGIRFRAFIHFVKKLFYSHI